MTICLRRGVAALVLLAGAAFMTGAALAAGPATGANTPPPALKFGGNSGSGNSAGGFNAADRADITRIEQYLNGVKTLYAKFVQAPPDGRQLTGTFWLSRPGKMRLTYDPPIKDFIVADGLFLFYWDGDMRQQSSAPIGSSLADVLLRKDLKLSGEVAVKALTRLPGALEITLAEASDPGKGSITLIFQDKPLSLIRWRVSDALGQITEVGLLDPKFGTKLDPDLFIFRAPKDEQDDGSSHR